MAIIRIAARAPAKVNLYLKVLGRRADGYHELDTLMAGLDLADRVGLTWSGGPGPDRLTVPAPSGGQWPADFLGAANLALKAAAAFRRRTGWPAAGLVISLEKNIPLGGGLGGGSSDGAAVLKLLNQTAPRPLAERELLDLGLSLGADVPFFLTSRPLARAGGVGEKLTPASKSSRSWLGRRLTLVNPGFQLSTAQVFKKLGLTNPPPGNTLGAEPEPGENDLLAPALTLAPALGEVVEAIRAARPEVWGLSGSGPTFWLYRPDSVRPLARPGWWVREAEISTGEPARL